MAMLLAMAVPGFSAWMANSKVRSAAVALVEDLRKAQGEAVRRSHQVALVRTTAAPTAANVASSASGTNWYLRVINLLAAELSTDSALDNGGFFIRGETMATSLGVSISGDAMICFNSLGRPVSNTTTTSDGFVLACAAPASDSAPRTFEIRRSGADRRLDVTVSLGGKIRVCDHDKAIADSPDGC